MAAAPRLPPPPSREGGRHDQHDPANISAGSRKSGNSKVSRRKFIVGSAAASGGLALGFHLPFGIGAADAQGAAATEVNAWVVVKPDNTCVIRVARSEMGQGTLTGLAQLVAEELECDWKKVTSRSRHARAEPRAQARLGRDGHRRQPRHPHLAGLCAARRRRRAHDADAGGRRSMEGAGRRAHGGERRDHARGLETHDDLRQGRRRGREAHAAGSEEHHAARIRRTGRSPASR